MYTRTVYLLSLVAHVAPIIAPYTAPRIVPNFDASDFLDRVRGEGGDGGDPALKVKEQMLEAQH